MRTHTSPLVLLLFAFSGIQVCAQTQPWAGIVDSSRAINWSNAGASISTSRTQCGSTIAAYGTSSSPASATTINSAIAQCGPNTYVQLGSGTFYLNSSIVFANGSSPVNNVTLRGAGANSTFLIFSGNGSSYSWCSSFDICAASSDTNSSGGPTNSAAWSAGYGKGTASVTLSSVSNLSVGNPMVLDQVDNQSDNGGLYVGCEIGSQSGGDSSAACYSGAGPTGFERGESSLSTIRGQQQVVTVTSIAGNGPYTVGISPALYAPNWGSSHSPGAWWASHAVQGDAVENLSMTASPGSSGGIFFFNCQNCWVKGIRGDLESSPGGSGWGQIVLSICDHCTVRDSYFYGNVNVDNYVVAVDIASDLLVENNIFQFPGTAQFYNSDCEGCVSDYNFSVNPLYSGSSNWLSQSADYHGVDLFSLAEGNIGTGLYADSFHGTHDLDTQFRNRWDGREQNNGSATSSNTVAVILNPGTRYQNVIGNILGTSGYHTTYKSTPSAHGSYNKSAIDAGWYDSASVGDALTNSTSMFWGNWDTATNAVRWCGGSSNSSWTTTCASTSEIPASLSSLANAIPGSTNLPASFIYSSQPSWWPSGKAWPPIGPDVTGGNVGQCSGGTYDSSEAISSSQCTGGTFQPVANGMVTSIPAMDCYFNTMKGNANGTGAVLSFNPSACYGAAATKTLGTPQNLGGSVVPK